MCGGGWGGPLVVVASVAREGSSQQNLNSLTLSRSHNVEQSSVCSEGRQLNEAFNQTSVRL